MLSGKIHFSRPPTASRLSGVLEGGAPSISMSKSCFERLSAKVRRLLDASDAQIIIKAARGRPINLSPELFLEIVELHRDNRTYRQIEDITGVPKSTVHYLIRYAQRQKLKSGGKIVYM